MVTKISFKKNRPITRSIEYEKNCWQIVKIILYLIEVIITKQNYNTIYVVIQHIVGKD